MSQSSDDQGRDEEYDPSFEPQLLPPQPQEADLACCEMMRYWAFDGDDIVVKFIPTTREWGIPISDYAGGGTVVFEYCPWCAVRLPESLRDRYYEELWTFSESGEDVPEWELRPEEYRSSAWWRRQGL
jgi:hypothetical protein